MTHCSTELLFDFYPQKPLSVDFEGGDLTSDAGLLLVRQADEKLGLTSGLAAGIVDWRNPFFIVHTLTDQVRQRVYQICAGYEDADDCDSLRGDPLLKITCDRLPRKDPDLASQPTMSRLENRVTRKDVSRLRKFFVDQFIASYATPPEELVLDVDGWDDPTHGAQQLTFFHGYYEHHMYYPVQISEARSGRPVVVQLRPGNSHAGKGIRGILAWLIWRLRSVWPSVRITLRGDCGFSLPEILNLCERLRIDYVLGIATNEVLKRKVEDLVEQARLQSCGTGEKARLFDDVYYRAKTWNEPRRVIMKAEWLEKGENTRFVITNRLDEAQTLYDEIYVQRGEECENRIKELKRGLKADRLSCHEFLANQFRLYLFQAAYWLMLEVREAAAETPFERAQVSRLREQLIKVGARVRETARRVWVHLASAFPWQNELRTMCARLIRPQPVGG